ncbi:YlmH family RNA-binding protein [Jeotgalibacillus campisalis]|uniref:RNA-binding protein S4 n=1 Tax=Jeotgalibacillus campisalis TaxID=220754 RepID=A0A0C2VFH0_9BACL|nr:RNA-binding protein [Jeotgalibacillus campisalis]KIL47642.1 RNA-binding protein S4 [Jeotgalibacillus campisalis]
MSLYQHFRKEEQGFIDRVLGWKDQTEQTYAPKLTDFLDPRQVFIVQSIIGTTGEVKVSFEGGDSAERKRALIYPDYLHPSTDDFDLQLLEITYPSKFFTVEHKHVLGSLMGLGIKREKFGDIIFAGEKIYLVAAKEFASFFTMNLNQIGKHSVLVKEVDWKDYTPSNEKWKERFVTLSSLRLDVVLAGALTLSRQKAQLLIQAGKIKVNFKEEEQPSFECAQGDMISVRGFGRLRIGEIEGKSKKDKWRLTIFTMGG